jgi:hypothetical protein
MTSDKRLGRPVKFTPERMQQIRNLVECGKRRRAGELGFVMRLRG